MTTPLSGRIALVTGAGIGIGQEIARELARQGAKVILHYANSAQGALDTVAEITQQGGEAIAIQGNLSHVKECRRVVEEAAQAFGGLDILVNNSGITRADYFQNITEEMYNDVFNLNMRGYFFCAQTAVPHMLKRGGGSIINITSIHAHGGFPRHTVYGSTKSAIIAFSRELAVELAPQHIRVNAIGPGLIEVPRYADIPGYTSELGGQIVPWGRPGQPRDVAPTVAFLASDAAEFITGQILYIDGGTTATLAQNWDQGDKPM